MRPIIALMVLFLLISPSALANDEKPTEKKATPVPITGPQPERDEILKFDADEIFDLVEQVVKDPKADRVAARAFLQKALDGKVVLTRLEVPVNEGTSSCEAKKCRSKLCRRCDFVTGKCFCSSCCLAAAP